jgi:hypothetical protein
MSIARALTPGRAWAASRTWRQFQRALGVASLAVLLGGALYGVETGLLGPNRRVVENPVDLMMRTLGLAHFAVGWLFLFTAPGLRTGRSLARLAGWSLVGAALCALYHLGGAGRNPLVVMAFYSLFLVHEAGDEASLFRRSGEAPAGPAADRFLRALGWTAGLGLTAALTGVHLLLGHGLRQDAFLAATPPAPLALGWLAVALAGVVAAARTLHLGRQTFGSGADAAGQCAPLLGIYATIFLILMLGSLLGSVGLNVIILLHVAAWLVFVHRQLGENPRPAPGLWPWLRRTPAGFLTLHLGAAGLILVLFTLRVHVWDRSGWGCELLAKNSFPYWSLMHITMAFARPR